MFKGWIKNTFVRNILLKIHNNFKKFHFLCYCFLHSLPTNSRTLCFLIHSLSCERKSVSCLLSISNLNNLSCTCICMQNRTEQSTSHRNIHSFVCSPTYAFRIPSILCGGEKENSFKAFSFLGLIRKVMSTSSSGKEQKLKLTFLLSICGFS